jgi:hypothetical protein
MKILIGFLVGFSFAYALFGDSARYGREVWSDVQHCSEVHMTACTAAPVVIRVDRNNEERHL